MILKNKHNWITATYYLEIYKKNRLKIVKMMHNRSD